MKRWQVRKMQKLLPSNFPSEIQEEWHQRKRMPPHVQPNFHGLENEDPDVFLFEFEVLRRGYYRTNDQNLNVFPLTLKGTTLRWFMSLDGNYIKLGKT